MLEMPIRTGRRVQDAIMSLREKVSRHTDQRQQVNSLHRQRMTCSDNLRSFTNTQDWTGGMGVSPSGRFQVVEQARPKRRFFTKEGIRWDTAWILLGAAMVLCVVILFADFASIGMSSRNISRLDSKIEDMSRRNEELRQQLAVDAGDVSVCTEAIKLNLISGSGAQTILLTVPQGYTADAVTAEVRGAAGWTTGDANP